MADILQLELARRKTISVWLDGIRAKSREEQNVAMVEMLEWQAAIITEMSKYQECAIRTKIENDAWRTMHGGLSPEDHQAAVNKIAAEITEEIRIETDQRNAAALVERNEARLVAQVAPSLNEPPATASISRAQMFDYMNAMVADRDAQIATFPTLYSCPNCAFTFDAAHTNESDGGYSCPVCAEAKLTAQIEMLEAEIEAACNANCSTCTDTSGHYTLWHDVHNGWVHCFKGTGEDWWPCTNAEIRERRYQRKEQVK